METVERTQPRSDTTLWKRTWIGCSKRWRAAWFGCGRLRGRVGTERRSCWCSGTVSCRDHLWIVCDETMRRHCSGPRHTSRHSRRRCASFGRPARRWRGDREKIRTKCHGCDGRWKRTGLSCNASERSTSRRRSPCRPRRPRSWLERPTWRSARRPCGETAPATPTSSASRSTLRRTTHPSLRTLLPLPANSSTASGRACTTRCSGRRGQSGSGTGRRSSGTEHSVTHERPWGNVTTPYRWPRLQRSMPPGREPCKGWLGEACAGPQIRWEAVRWRGREATQTQRRTARGRESCRIGWRSWRSSWGK
mmetsp:Transcript_72428/g.170352  ORF Transcript_72428/g.170352 Transcript_72428/m.170352 type:complete len:307 (+) Transcript_72428:108-1028(+)